MSSTKELVKSIIEGIQEKKGRDIVIADFTHIPTAPSEYFVICSGNSPQHVDAICDAAEEFARIKSHEKPSGIVGTENSLWVAMDYGTVMVHILVPEARDHYDLENLWEDAQLTEVPNID